MLLSGSWFHRLVGLSSLRRSGFRMTSQPTLASPASTPCFPSSGATSSAASSLPGSTVFQKGSQGEYSMSVGDVNSNERGSGARFNDGKVPLDLVPVRYWQMAFRESENWTTDISVILTWLADVQERRVMTSFVLEPSQLVTAARVFEYGAEKYAPYNWVKGMKWSIPIGCALRHLYAILHGEEIDPESGLPHLGHVYCNVIMLNWFLDNYPEGDDRIPPEAFGAPR